MVITENIGNTSVRKATVADKKFWFSLDKHLPRDAFANKLRDGRCYVLSVDGISVGILRYDMLWDEIPFCALLYIDANYRRRGYGAILLRAWEKDMAESGHDIALASTRSDETAQHLYRALGYADSGTLDLRDRPSELFLSRSIDR